MYRKIFIYLSSLILILFSGVFVTAQSTDVEKALAGYVGKTQIFNYVDSVQSIELVSSTKHNLNNEALTQSKTKGILLKGVVANGVEVGNVLIYPLQMPYTGAVKQLMGDIRVFLRRQRPIVSRLSKRKEVFILKSLEVGERLNHLNSFLGVESFASDLKVRLAELSVFYENSVVRGGDVTEKTGFPWPFQKRTFWGDRQFYNSEDLTIGFRGLSLDKTALYNEPIISEQQIKYPKSNCRFLF